MLKQGGGEKRSSTGNLGLWRKAPAATLEEPKERAVERRQGGYRTEQKVSLRLGAEVRMPNRIRENREDDKRGPDQNRKVGTSSSFRNMSGVRRLDAGIAGRGKKG